MFLLGIDNIRIDKNYLKMLEEKKNKLFRFLVYEKKFNNLKLFRTYLRSLTRLEDLMNFKSAQFEANSRIESDEYYQNLLKAFDYIVDEVIKNRSIKDQKTLLYLHYLIDPKNHAKNPGKTRNSLVMIGEHQTPEPNRVFSLIENMFFNASEITNPIIKGIYFHHELVRIHPFSDGNGRIARLVENWVLMLDLFPPMIISTLKDRQGYIRSLDKSFASIENNPDEANENTTLFFNSQMKRLNNSLDYLYTRLKL